MKYNIALKTEFSFRQCFLPMRDIHKYALNGVVGIADYDNTFGHIPLQKEADKHGFKPIFGVRLRVSRAGNERLQTGQLYTTFIAKNNDGLQALYELVHRAYVNFHFFPRLVKSDIEGLHPGIANLGEGIHENFYPRAQDRSIYQLLTGARKDGRSDGYIHRFENRAGSMRIIPCEGYDDLVSECSTRVPSAQMVKWGKEVDILSECLKGAKERGIELNDEYMSRLQMECNLITKKEYVDYFMIVSDMIRWAKKTMLVGPSRGSSAGSLVCYLLGITEVDPVKHHLIFERFIDENRHDLPDIDVDFPDKYRHNVLEYLVNKYGRECVRSLGNINTFQPRYAIKEFAQSFGIPAYEADDVKGAIIERSSGDARSAMCITDTFNGTEPGRAFIAKYPKMRLVERIEDHASHPGKHAAGVMVSNEPLSKFAASNPRDDVLMMDKDAAEYIGLLKIDCLGLRTLSIIMDTVSQIDGMSFDDIYDLPLDDEDTFRLFNEMRLYGIFQFEGQALRILTRQMGVHKFDDIVAITALARPGALNSGGADRFIKYRTGQDTPVFINDAHRKVTGDTYGVTVFQEQMMEIARNIGHLEWKDVQTLRKAASKSLGDEFFGKWKSKFIKGAMELSGLSLADSEKIWNDISHSGSWSFNKSHAVSYGLISYWTAYLKAHWPLQFAVAALNNENVPEKSVNLLRDLVTNDGLEYIPVDPAKSMIHWTVNDGKLLGGLCNIKGVQEKKAQMFIDMREGRRKCTPSFWEKMSQAETPYDIIFPTMHHWGIFWTDPLSTGLVDSKPDVISSIMEEGEYTFIGKLVDRNLRDLNEYTFLKDRGGERIEENNLYLNFTVEDDTDSILCTINRWNFSKNDDGRKIAEEGKVGESWYLIYGRIRGTWRKIDVIKVINLNEWKENGYAN